jgi:hypothetical protein
MEKERAMIGISNHGTFLNQFDTVKCPDVGWVFLNIYQAS